jgi:hypothetical protein
MRRKRTEISRAQWIIIISLEIAGCIAVGALFWGVFVSPKPPDFSALLATRPPPTAASATLAATTLRNTASESPAAPALEVSPTPTGAEAASTPTETPTPSVQAQVADNGVGLNMRAGPDSNQAIVARLLPLTALTIVGRSPDDTWLLAIAEPGVRGWVAAEFVNVSGALDPVPVTTATVEILGELPTATSTPIPPSPIDSGDYPYILGVTQHAREIFAAGQGLGNRANVFSKVGDSITVNDHFLVPFGRGGYNLADYAYLQPVIDYFASGSARHGNSFVNDSLSASPGWSSWTAINIHAADETICAPGEVPIECELRMVKPAIALIMLGTNDVPDTDYVSPAVYESQMRRLIESCIRAGVIPVVSTIPAFHRETGFRVALFNDVIFKLTDEYDVPLWNYWAAMQSLPNNGLSSDGVHPSVSPASGVDFSAEALQYGMNVRNLTALQALDAVWRSAMR